MKIAILGRGISGNAAARLAEASGSEYHIFCDGDETDSYRGFNLIVASPGFAADNRLRREAAQSGVPLISELEFGAINFTGRYLAITGTNGKTTTTELTAHLLNALGVDAVPAGNIGAAVSDLAAEVLISGKTPPVAVIEVSSFQLELTEKFAPAAAVVLNLASDHLNRYRGSMAEYGAVKGRIFTNTPPEGKIIGESLRNSETVKLLNAGNKFANALNVAADQDTIEFAGRTVCRFSESLLKGAHNLENLIAALELIRCFCGDDALFGNETVAAVNSFRPGAHRMETILEVDGVTFINDSKATNPHAVIAALRAVGINHDVHLLLGGLDKDMNFEELSVGAKYIKKAYLLGECRHKINDALRHHFPCDIFDTFDEAVLAAATAAKKGEIVMLSPACASMDMFKNYQERGERFRSAVLNFARA